MLQVAKHLRSPSIRFVCTPCRDASRNTALRVGLCRYNSTLPPSKPPSSPSPPEPSTSTAQPTPHPAKPPAPSLDSPEAYRQNPDLARYISDLAEHSDAPDLMVQDPLLDPAEVHVFPPTKDLPYENKVVFRNDEMPLFEGYDKLLEELGEAPEEVLLEQKQETGREFLPYDGAALRRLLRRTLLIRRVTVQTGKGKIHRKAALTITGNGAGLVGVGYSKNDDTRVAIEKSFVEAVRTMDYVERFEERTVWTELATKFGGTRVILRPRPIGFGLRCNPYIHEILKLAGIKDCSAKVWGSRNPYNVVMATFRLLQPGNHPLGMGDGIGGRGKKMEKGIGMRPAPDLERERGRKLASLRTV
ncbi:hypothetical protein EIP86_000637 [Pleurotus ostreatoroseus]|nr:hypothetical protein EIP86_000637 [Pleurotus ostreatoroseus]